MAPPTRIGIAGTGFIGRGLAVALEAHEDLCLSAVLTRRDLNSFGDLPYRDNLTNSIQEFVDRCDLIVECSGDVVGATEVVHQSLTAGLPVVTMNAEFHVTTGSYFVGKGMLTEAEGDQPGCLAVMAEQAKAIGFKPIVYGNRKGYYHPNPPIEQMQYWAEKQAFSLPQVTSFTDGTKLHIEVALAANGLNGSIAKDGPLGIEAEDLKSGALVLAHHAERIGRPLADYVLAPRSPMGVFLVVKCDARHTQVLRNMAVGDGPYYVLINNYHLCYLEIPKTIRRVIDGGTPLLTNSAQPSVGVSAVAKRRLKPGETIRRGIGSVQVRGTAVAIGNHPDHVPIGLLTDAVVQREIEPGQQLTLGDVDIPETRALQVWREMQRRAAPANGATESTA